MVGIKQEVIVPIDRTYNYPSQKKKKKILKYLKLILNILLKETTIAVDLHKSHNHTTF